MLLKTQIVLTTLLLMLATLRAPAVKAADSDLQDLRERFKQRHAKIQSLKSDGVIGETAKGYIDFVKDQPADALDVVKEENGDRKKLYETLAEKEGVAVVKVAERNAKRNFEKAASGDFLQQPSGKWVKKG